MDSGRLIWPCQPSGYNTDHGEARPQSASSPDGLITNSNNSCPGIIKPRAERPGLRAFSSSTPPTAKATILMNILQATKDGCGPMPMSASLSSTRRRISPAPSSSRCVGRISGTRTSISASSEVAHRHYHYQSHRRALCHRARD